MESLETLADKAAAAQDAVDSYLAQHPGMTHATARYVALLERAYATAAQLRRAERIRAYTDAARA